MSTEFHDEPGDDVSSFWNKDPGLVQHSSWTRSRRWLTPALTSTVVIIIVLAFGLNNGALSSRLGSLEDSVSNLSLSLSSAHNNNKEATKEVQRLKFSVESSKDQLSSVAESVKQLAQVDSLSKTVASLKCLVDQILHNGSRDSVCCPLDWENFQTSCYYFSKSALNWHDARDWCHAHQSHLLILQEDKEWDYIHSRAMGTWYWLGLTDESGDWEWVNGTPYVIDRRRWRPGQPDNWRLHGLGDGAEDCAQIHANGQLNDLHCSTRLRFICQRRGEQR